MVSFRDAVNALSSSMGALMRTTGGPMFDEVLRVGADRGGRHGGMQREVSGHFENRHGSSFPAGAVQERGFCHVSGHVFR
jgi:hypothetical protein